MLTTPTNVVSVIPLQIAKLKIIFGIWYGEKNIEQHHWGRWIATYVRLYDDLYVKYPMELDSSNDLLYGIMTVMFVMSS